MSSKKIVGTIATVLLLIGGGLGVYKIYQQNAIPVSNFEAFTRDIASVNESLQEQIVSIPQDLADELDATRIYFMLTNKAKNHDDQYTQSFAFENGSLSAAVPKDQDSRDLYYNFSLNTEKGVFFAIPQELRNTDEAISSQQLLYSFEVKDTAGVAFPAVEQAELRDGSRIANKQNPSISNSGEILFVGWEPDRVPQIEQADSWSIYKVRDGEAEFLTNGFMPKWISDTEFVYIKNDGLHIASGDLSTDRVLSSSAGPVLSNNRIDVSDDGTRIAWMQPNNSEIVIFEKNSDSFEEKAVLPGKGFWVAFSPSGNYAALQTIDPQAGGTEEHPGAKIEFYDISTNSKVPQLEIDLDAFDQLGMFMTDWIKK